MPHTISETNKAIKEIWALFKETDVKFKETQKEIKETQKEIRETQKEIRESNSKWEKTQKALDDLTGKWSKFVEGIIVPNTIKIFKERGIEVEQIFPHVKASKNGLQMEIDLMLINGEYAILVEVKSTLKVKDIDEHIKRIQKFKKVFPVYKDRKVIGAVAGIAIEERADRYAYHQGFFVLGQSGETVKILNDKKFKPKIW